MTLYNRLQPDVMYVTQRLKTNDNSVRYTTVNIAVSTTAQKRFITHLKISAPVSWHSNVIVKFITLKIMLPSFTWSFHFIEVRHPGPSLFYAQKTSYMYRNFLNRLSVLKYNDVHNCNNVLLKFNMLNCVVAAVVEVVVASVIVVLTVTGTKLIRGPVGDIPCPPCLSLFSLPLKAQCW